MIIFLKDADVGMLINSNLNIWGFGFKTWGDDNLGTTAD